MSAAEAEAKVGGKAARLNRDEKRRVVLNLLERLAAYVETIAQSDRSISALAGMPLTKIPEPVGPITSVPAPTLKPGVNEGEMDISQDKVPGALDFDYKITDDPTLPIEQWRSVNCNRLKCTITGLTSGRRYHVKIAARGKDMQCVYSPTVSAICM